MPDRVWKSDFDWEKYIEKSVQDISDIEDLRIMKELIRNVIGPVWEYAEEKSIAIEKKLTDYLTAPKDSYDIYTSIAPKKNLDITAPHLYPMCGEDLVESTLNLQNIAEEIRDKGEATLFPVILDMSYPEIQELMISRNLE